MNLVNSTIATLGALVMQSFPAKADTETRGVDHQRVAFVTSASGPPVFGDWPEAAGSLTGLEAADSICANLASQAGLLSPGDFRAWISDSNDDAYCRLHQRTGEKSANCGEPALPALAGPWVRTDGTPWAAGAPDFLSPDFVVYTPLSYDETGNEIDLTANVWTATDSTGGLSFDATCTDWTATPDQDVSVGAVDLTGSQWTNNGSRTCQTQVDLHLYCLETTQGPALDLPPPPERLVFITDSGNEGKLDNWPEADPGPIGVEAGDSICNNIAQAAGMPDVGTYKAWLSDASVAAPDRFDHDGPWYRRDGIKVAENIADLIDGALQAPINLTENLDYLSAGAVWTGTNSSGGADANHCASWKADIPDPLGLTGAANASDGDWTQRFVGGCSPSYRLYCFSDALPERFFTEGFEVQ